MTTFHRAPGPSNWSTTVSDNKDRRKREAGQALVLMVGGLIAMLAMVGLIVDGGSAFAHQRETQNGTDAAANAGALLLAQGINATTPSDSAVLAAINSTATSNNLASTVSYYTDVIGQLLTPLGTPTTNLALAVEVGSAAGNLVPPCVDPNTCVNGRASGVNVIGRRSIGTFVVGVVGIGSIPVTARATAVAGYLSGTCDAAAGCNVMPVTFPVTVLTCDGSNNPAPLVPPTYYQVGVHYTIPLCKNGPGNVGWLDWTPPAGGASELVDSILYPDNPPIPVPSWQYITMTGNVNSANVEDALNTYAGQVVLIPQFDATCDTQPSGNAVGNCPIGNLGGNGTNQWYHLPQFSALLLDTPKAVYVNGSNKAECEENGNGATSCIKGTFVNFVTGGVVGPGVGTGGNTSVVGVQLIK